MRKVAEQLCRNKTGASREEQRDEMGSDVEGETRASSRRRDFRLSWFGSIRKNLLFVARAVMMHEIGYLVQIG